MRLCWRTKKRGAKDRKKVLDFLKDYNTDNLTLIFTDEWTQRYHYPKENKYKWLKLPKRSLGIYYHANNRSRWFYGLGGELEVYAPIIIVDCRNEGWYNTFLHELGHHIDRTTNGWSGKRGRNKSKEAFANDFARKFDDTAVQMGVDLSDDDAVMQMLFPAPAYKEVQR